MLNFFKNLSDASVAFTEQYYSEPVIPFFGINDTKTLKEKLLSLPDSDYTSQYLSQYIEQYRKIAPDQLVDLKEIDLSYKEFANSYKDLRGIDFEKCDLTNTNLEKADLVDANLTGANLTGANLTGAKLVGTNLTGANLTGAKLKNIYPVKANLKDADLTGADLGTVGNLFYIYKVNFVGTKFNKVNLESANFKKINLEGANFTCANLTGANLTGADLRGASLEKASLVGANLERANLKNTNFVGADLSESTMSNLTEFNDFKPKKFHNYTLLKAKGVEKIKTVGAAPKMIYAITEIKNFVRVNKVSNSIRDILTKDPKQNKTIKLANNQVPEEIMGEVFSFIFNKENVRNIETFQQKQKKGKGKDKGAVER